MGVRAHVAQREERIHSKAKSRTCGRRKRAEQPTTSDEDWIILFFCDMPYIHSLPQVTAIWEMIFFNCILTEFLHLPTK